MKILKKEFYEPEELIEARENDFVNNYFQ